MRSVRKLLCCLVVGVTLVLAACAPASDVTPAEPGRFDTAEPEVMPTLVVDGNATENLEFFTEILRQFAVSDNPVEGQPIVTAVVDAGFDKSLMQVSFDRSQTNLVADNIFISVRYGSECLVGQVVTADRSFYAEVMPALGPQTQICLIGNTRPIDW